MVHGVCQVFFEVAEGCFCSACCFESLESKATMMGKYTAVFYSWPSTKAWLLLVSNLCSMLNFRDVTAIIPQFLSKTLRLHVRPEKD